MKHVDENKICFIACVNDEFLYGESVFYIEHLQVPDGMHVDMIAVRGAESMTAGYQAAMEASDAKYKIYIHQDVFIVNRNILHDLLAIFKANKDIGLIGVAGSVTLDKNRPVWWNSETRCGKVYHKSSSEEIHLSVYGDFLEAQKQVAAVDGVLMATQHDVPWRSDLFKGWHFYDISQSREFDRHGYQIVVAGQKEPWIVHVCGRKIPGKPYDKEMEIFKENYSW